MKEEWGLEPEEELEEAVAQARWGECCRKNELIGERDVWREWMLQIDH